MKQVLIFLGVLSIGFSACKKDDKNNAMEFTVNGISDVTLNYQKTLLPIAINHVSGPQEQLSLGVSGLPAGITAQFSSVTGTPAFTSVLEFISPKALAPGVYALKVTGTAKSGAAKSYDMNLTVPDCVSALTGDYNAVWDYEDVPDQNTVVTVKKDPAHADRVIIVEDGRDIFYAVVSCGSSSLTVPDQDGVSGTGSFSFIPAKAQFEFSASGETIKLTLTR